VFSRCEDANLIDVPVKISCADPRLYHVAFFAQVDISPLEELTWDYGCSFKMPEVEAADVVVPFRCKCGSTHCRDKVIDDHSVHPITELLPQPM
jgi:SET domain-containing protein